LNNPYFELDVTKKTLYCQGEWTLKTLMSIKKKLHALGHSQHIRVVNGQNITKMDSAGCLVLHQWIRSQGKIQLEHFSDAHQNLFALVSKNDEAITVVPHLKLPPFLEKTGRLAVKKLEEFTRFLNFIGENSVIALRLLFHVKRIPFRSMLSIIETTGVYALPIVGLLSFLIGMVLTYQMGLQLKNYGANIYIADLLGIAIFREFAPLMTAIIIAGRSGSAFTAQLGTMKIREEVDALQTMGLSPYELLVIPRLMGLFIALPLLTVWAGIFGIAGGMLISKLMLHIEYVDFIHRFYDAISVNTFLIGMIKAPVFGLIIASVGCFQGLRVFGSANSVGEKTTISVVQSIFFIIVVDAAFSILFSWLNIK